MSFWDKSLLKDTVFWLCGVAFPLTMRTIRAKESSYFKKVVFNSFKLAILFEFVINLYSFSIGVEIIFLPLLTLLVLMQEIAKTEKKHEQVNRMIGQVISFLGLIVLIYALYKTFINYQASFSVFNLKTLLLPAILTLFFIPFIYLVALYTNYETLFIRIHYFSKNLKIIKNIKLRILKVANFNINKLGNISSKINPLDLDEALSIETYLRTIASKSNSHL